MVKINTMNQAVSIFGSKAEIARTLKKTPSAISAWPNKLNQDQKDILLGAAIRVKKVIVIMGELVTA